MAKETFSFEEAAAPAAPAPAVATKPVTFSFEEAAAPVTKPAAAATFSFEEAAKSSPAKAAPNNGMLEAGNIDLANRPRVKNSDGSISTVRSMGVNIGGKEVLIPTISEDGRIMTDDEAVQAYRSTGRHLGMFSTPEAATRYAEQLHNDQAKLIQAPTEQPAGVTDPSGADFGQQIMAVASPRRESVLEGVQMPEPKLDPAEAQRLSRRDYAESHPVPGTEGRSGAVMRQGGETKPADPMFERGAAIRDASMPVRATFKAVSGVAKGAGGVLRSAGDLTGIPQLTAAGQATSAGAEKFEQGMGDVGPVAGFGPKSPVPYLGNMAEGAASSLGQSTMMATSFGPRAVIPLLSVMTAGQEYERARNAGLDPAMALAGAIPKGTFEAIGEKFTGLDKVAGAMGTLLTRGASEQAKHTAADVLVRAGIREVPGEIITYLGQTATDLLPGIGLNPDLTMGQFLDGLRDTTVQAAMMGATFGSGGVVAKADPRIKRLRDAGENEAADLLQKRQDQLNLQASVISELSGMQSEQTRSPEFQAGYIGLRADGTKPVEAAGRSALNAGFRQTATAAGMSEKAIAAAMEASRKISLDKLPGFLQRYTQGLANRGAIQAPDAALGTLLEAARDDAMDLATQSLYGDASQTMDAAQALESGQNQAPAVDNAAPEAMSSVAPAESVQAVDNIERILGQQTTRPDIDQAAHAAATSPLNDLPEPTQAQKEAGNYQKGHINLHGLDIAIENPQGSERRGVSPDGKEWSSTLASHYGYFKRTNGNDGDHVDTFIGPNPDSTKVFVVDQLNKDGSFDEHKVMLGFDSLEDADRGYHANYEPGWTGRGAITEVPLPAFKSWVRDGKKKEPISAIQFKTQEAGQGQGAAGTFTPEAPDAAANAGNGVEGDAARAVQPAAVADLQPGTDQHPAVELSGKTPAQLAAMERAAKRLRLPHTGSGPLSAHAFIAAEGGLSRAAMADTGFDANVRVGNRWLFAAQGKGLTLEQAAMKLAQAGYMPTESESDAADLIRRSMTQPQYTAEGWQALAEAEHAARYEDHLAAQQEADTGADPLAPEGFTDAELEQSGYDDASPEVQAEVRALLATAEDQGIDAETVLENVAKTTENANQQAYYETAKRALETAIAAQSGSAGDQRPPAGSESPAPGQEQDPGQVGQEPQQTPADAGVSVSGFTVEPRADGTLAVKGDAKAIREALSAIPAKLLVTMKGGILVGRTQAEKAQAILRGEKPKLTAREATEAGERARQAEKKARQQAARAESTAAPAGLSIGIMPSTAEAVTVRNGVVFIGDNEAIGYDSGEPVTVAAGASDQQIVDALKESGALSRRQRVFGLAKADSEGLTAPTREDVIAQQERADTAAERDQREQVRRESEAGSGQFSLTQEDGRQDTTGSLFDQPSKPNEQSALARGAPVWRSALHDGVATIPAKAQGADGWRAQIQGLVNKGAVKADEVEWSGVTDWLQMQTGKVTKEQVLDYLDGNGVQVEEVTLQEDGRRTGGSAEDATFGNIAFADNPRQNTKYGAYTLPGGQNYREVLLTYPTTGSKAQERIRKTDSALKNYLETEKAFSREGARDYALDAARGELTEGQLRFAQSDAEQMRLINAQREAWIAREKATSSEGFKSSHWDQQNVLAHIRVNDRTDADGKRVLFVEEIQSDWGQSGKRNGFNLAPEKKARHDELRQKWLDNTLTKEEGEEFDALGAQYHAGSVPTAPFVTKTDAWLNLALKRIITMAAQEGYDKVAFVNGEQSADRYDLSKSIDSMIVGKEVDGTYSLVASRDGRELIKRNNVPAGELENLVGKEMAKKIVDGDGKDIGHGEREFSGIDLKVGGEGMKAFYDQIVPNAAKALLKKLGGGELRTAQIELPNPQVNKYFPSTFDPDDAKVLQRGDVFQVWANGKMQGDGNFDTREAAEAFMATGGRPKASVQTAFDITDAMREKAAKGLPMFARSGMDADAFRRAFSPPQAMSVAGAQKIIDELTATWENGPKFKAVATSKELPITAPRDTRGWVSENGTAYIVAGNHVSRDAIAQTLAHEAIGHYGLWKILGKDGKAKFERNLQMALKTGNKPLAKIRDKVRRLYVDDAGKFNLSPAEEANEIAAFAVEEAVDPVTGEFTTGMSWLKQFWAQIADFLRGLGLPVKFTKAELHGLLVASMKGLQAGHRLDGGAEVLVAAARDASPEGKALQALGENDDLFALPRSDKTTVEEIAAETDPKITVKTTKQPGLVQTYVLTMPDGAKAKLMVRKVNPYGAQAYGMLDQDDVDMEAITERPGENAQEVPDDTEDVYIDVSNLKEGGYGSMVYNIAATYAHNTGRILIGDPAGLSDDAMRRRTENMLSSALKFGTTRHLAPHPRQTMGAADIGVPPMRWTYGDDMGNIQELIRVSNQSLDYAGGNPFTFDTSTGTFRDSEGGAIDDDAISLAVEAGSGRAQNAGVTTLKRNAVLSALVREEGKQGGGRGPGAGILAQLVDVGRQYPASVNGIFYARGKEPPAAGSLTSGALARGTAATGGAIQSPPKSSQWRDTTGRAVFAPGQALYNLIGKAANPLLVKLQLKAASPELRRQLRQMKLDVQKAQDVAVAVAKESQKLTSAERLMVSDIIEKELAAGTVPPEHAVRLAAAMNTAMGEQSKELIRLGMLTPETAAQWDGRYLPRFYESKLRKQVGETWADAARLIGLRPKSLKGIGGKHLKGRGLFETIPENQLAHYEAMGWQVRDPDYTPSLPSVDGTVQVWRDYSRQERDAMGEIRDAGFRFVMGYMQTQRDIALGRMFEGMAANPETSSRLPRDGWVRVPDTTVEGTGAKRYGKLAGRYVPMETLSQLTNIEEAQSAAWRMYRSAMAVWKEGKALALDTPIPTPTGWTTMGDIKLGDEIFDERGARCRVTFATPVQLDRQCFEVEFSDGETIVADAEHLWFTIKQGHPGVRNTVAILDTLKYASGRYNQHSVPVALPLQTTTVALPVDPYFIGVWLGNGDSCGSSITSNQADSVTIMSLLADRGFGFGSVRKDPRGDIVTYGVGFNGHRPRKELLQPTLRAIGVLGNKHIPAVYLRASEAQRMDLLRGLMDTDGTIDAAGKVSFCTASTALKDGFIELARSLGFKPVAYKHTKLTQHGTPCEAWIIRFHATVERPVFALPRKVARLTSATERRARSATRQIVAIRPVASVPVRCIQVDSESHLYLAGRGMIPTHNTALNPVSHVNNVLSNLTMAHFAGIGYHRFDKYLGAMQDFVKAAPMVKEARDAGLFLGTMSDAELMNTLPPELKELAVKADSKTKKGAEAVYNAMTFWLRKPMGAAYQAEDTFFRYLIYRDARQRGTDPQDAVDYAQKYIFTYDDLPKGARMVRDFGIPFFAYTYKAVPALLNTALTRPDRFLAPAAVLWAANAAAYAIAAGDDDDSWMERLNKYLSDPEFRAKARESEKLEREFLPPWMKGTTALMTPKAIRLGMDELTKLPVFIDTSRIIPGGDLFDVSPNAMGLPIPQPVTPSHPLFTTAVAMIGNKDLFFGKEIIDSNDTRAEAAEKRAAWIWKQVSPAIAVNNYHWERGMSALAQAAGGELKWVPDFLGGDATGIGRDGNPVQAKYAAMQTFGIKARPIDLETSEQIDNNQRNKMIRDIDAEIRKLQRLNAKGAIADRVLESEWEKALVKKERLREGLTVDGDEKP